MKEEKPLRFYGRRKGKALRVTKLGAYEEVLPAMRLALPEGEAKIDPRSFFTEPPEKIWFEIGFGAGEHLLHHAIANPGIGMIGAEPFINGIAALCQGIQEHNVKNICIWPDDVRLILPRIEDRSIDRLFVLNSDPWPKTRHHKRRFIQQETLDEIHRILKPGAEFRMSSDHPGLAVWQLEKTYFHGGFDWLAKSKADWENRPDDFPETRYQKKGATEGRPTVFLNFIRK